jgi:NADH dehydrogenase [ubiquinone] 1 alpha subcomplex assembly factor 7
MEACLYDPEHGYYRKKDPLGRGGDFITAPEISQVFGELIGLWAGETWRLMGQPASIRLIELGPGRGTLMADALRALRLLPSFLKSVSIHLIETSEALRDAQKAALANAPCPIFWHGRIADVPGGASIVIANEFLDCLPVRQFVFDEPAQVWHERVVTIADGEFKIAAAVDASAVPVGAGTGAEDGAILELRPAIAGLCKELAKRAELAPFAALIVDYGYSLPSFGDTIQAVKQHRFSGLFDAPGEADLTAHVGFTELVRAADALNLNAFGPMPMGEWLLRLGLEARVRQLSSHASEEQAADLQGRIARLIDPKQMGALFKAVVLTGGGLGPLPPF